VKQFTEVELSQLLRLSKPWYQCSGIKLGVYSEQNNT